MRAHKRQDGQKISPLVFFCMGGKMYIYLPRSIWKRGRKGLTLYTVKDSQRSLANSFAPLVVSLRYVDKDPRGKKQIIHKLLVWPEGTIVRAYDSAKKKSGWIRIGTIANHKLVLKQQKEQPKEDD